jgi:hypothetical protein
MCATQVHHMTLQQSERDKANALAASAGREALTTEKAAMQVRHVHKHVIRAMPCVQATGITASGL